MVKSKHGLQSMDTPLYSYWRALYLSFYSKQVYIDVGKRWKGVGLLYLLLLVSIVCIPFAARVIYDYNRYFEVHVLAPMKALPTLYLQNGVLVFDKVMPYFVKNKQEKIVAIIDTTGKLTGIPREYPDVSIVLTRDKLYYRAPAFELFFTTQEAAFQEKAYVQSYPKDLNQVFVGKEWVASQHFTWVKCAIGGLIYLFIVGGLYGLYALFALVLGSLGQIFSSVFFNFKLTYRQSCRLITIAMTPQLLVFMIGLTSTLVVPGRGFFYIAMLGIYYYYAVMSLSRASKTMARVGRAE